MNFFLHSGIYKHEFKIELERFLLRSDLVRSRTMRYSGGCLRTEHEKVQLLPVFNG